MILPPIIAEITFKLVKEMFAIVEIDQFRSNIIVDVECFHRFRFHIHIPHFQGEIVPGENVATIGAEFDVVDRCKDF